MIMKVFENPSKEIWDDLSSRPTFSWEEIARQIRPVLNAVSKEGDQAIRNYTKRWDHVDINDLLVSQNEINAAVEMLDNALKEAIQLAYYNIKKFHLLQKDDERITETMPGVLCWQKSVPIQRVGLYIPGGSAPLFSTVLMLGIPAKLAGCPLIQLATPPDQDGAIHPGILYAAHLVGVDRIVKAGGAQAIAGMIYGTDSIKKVDKIFGPGNQYVTAAKQIGQQEGVAMDLPAGPSEVLVMVDDSSDPQFVAADLIAQAEHGADSQVVVVADGTVDMKPILNAVNNQLRSLPRKDIAQQAIKNSIAVQFDSPADMLQFVNHYAPEHLIISMENAEHWADQVVNAGSIFLGNFTPESVGDYASGTNHTLPTNGYARNYSGVNIDAFVKKITYQKLSETGIMNLGPAVMTMARAEELEGHAQAVALRLNAIKHKK